MNKKEKIEMLKINFGLTKIINDGGNKTYKFRPLECSVSLNDELFNDEQFDFYKYFKNCLLIELKKWVENEIKKGEK